MCCNAGENVCPSEIKCCDPLDNMWSMNEPCPQRECKWLLKMGFDASQIPFTLLPKCPCCGCRQNLNEVQGKRDLVQDPCSYDSCIPAHQRLYEAYFDSFTPLGGCARTCGTQLGPTYGMGLAPCSVCQNLSGSSAQPYGPCGQSSEVLCQPSGPSAQSYGHNYQSCKSHPQSCGPCPQSCGLNPQSCGQYSQPCGSCVTDFGPKYARSCEPSCGPFPRNGILNCGGYTETSIAAVNCGCPPPCPPPSMIATIPTTITQYIPPPYKSYEQLDGCC